VRPTFPIDYSAIRQAFAAEIKAVTGLIAIIEEPVTQNAPRPCLPYFSFKLTTPGAKSGDDSTFYAGDGATTLFGKGGNRKMSVSFNCYAATQEEAYDYMALWQGSLELPNVQAVLRESGIAVWLIGTVADLSALLNTGYEGRSHMDVQFGIASNLVEDDGAIEHADITGTVDLGDGGEPTVVEFEAP
jgi:hypothetical protein